MKEIKKPIEIEFEIWTGMENCIPKIQKLGLFDFGFTVPTGELDIKTLEGVITASPGDYIIKGVEGEFYPCKPDIFKKTYDIIN